MKIVIVHPLTTQWPPFIPLVDEKARALAKLGDEVVVVCPRKGETRMYDNRLPSARILPLDFENGWVSRSVKHEVALFNPDIIHVWTPRSLPSRAALELFIATGARLVVNYEDPEQYHFDTMTGPVKSRNILDYMDKPFISPEDVENFLAKLNWHWIMSNINKPDCTEFLHPIYYALLNQMASGFTGICRQWTDLLNKRFRKPTIWLPHSVDFSRHPQHLTTTGKDIRDELGIDRDTLLLLRSGTIYQWTNDMDIFLAAFMKFTEQYPNSVLVMCGVDLNRKSNRIMDTIKQMNIENNIKWLGFLNHESYINLLATADIALCPGYPDEYNRYRLATKIVDYMVAGKPMISYASGIGEDMVHGKDAFLLDEYTPDAICSQMLELARNKNLRKELGRNARARAEEWFDTKSIAQRLHNFYERITHENLSSKQQPRPPVEYNHNALFNALNKTLPLMVSEGAEKIALYGAGKHTRRLLQMNNLAPLSIQCIVDDNPQTDDIMGIPVIRPSNINAYSIDTILISSDSMEPLLKEQAKLWMPPECRLLSLYEENI